MDDVSDAAAGSLAMTAGRPRDLFSLDGRVAVVTGGSRGLGLQIAEALGRYGARIMLVARGREELLAARERLREQGIVAAICPADLGDDRQVAQVVEAAMLHFGSIDVLVNNAGVTWGAPVEEYPVEAWDRIFRLNVRGAFLLSQAVGKLAMLPNGYGRVINVASIAGLMGNMPDVMRAIGYNTSKGALINFTRALAAEWGGRGITVNALAPGFFPSKMTHGVIDRMGELAAASVPSGRLGGDGDLMGPALLLASDAGSHINGQVIVVDGGASVV